MNALLEAVRIAREEFIKACDSLAVASDSEYQQAYEAREAAYAAFVQSAALLPK